ncbi:hypothetical protein L1887_32084 [Cichorium endivia]|nr:hypothetical protein L1887_32084 [Cichorium endivia]
MVLFKVLEHSYGSAWFGGPLRVSGALISINHDFNPFSANFGSLLDTPLLRNGIKSTALQVGSRKVSLYVARRGGLGLLIQFARRLPYCICHRLSTISNIPPKAQTTVGKLIMYGMEMRSLGSFKTGVILLPRKSMTLKEYPGELSVTSLICLVGMAEGGIIAMIMEHDPKAWSLGFDSRLLHLFIL